MAEFKFCSLLERLKNLIFKIKAKTYRTCASYIFRHDLELTSKFEQPLVDEILIMEEALTSMEL